MAIGMEVYNIAIKMGFNLQMGGFSSMTNAVFPAALVEASYMGLFVFLFSNPIRQPLRRGLCCQGNKPGEGQSVFLPADAAGGNDCRHVPDHEHGGIDPIQCDPGQAVDYTAPGYLGRHSHQGFPRGFFLEYVCRCAVYSVDL